MNVTDPVNSDAALVRKALLDTTNALVPGTMGLASHHALVALDRLAAAAERADELEEMRRELCLHQGLPEDAPPERIIAHLRGNREFAEGFRQIAAETALLAAQQQVTDLERERDILFKGDWAMLNQQLERAEATNTRLRERMENAANALPDPMHPDFPREFEDAQARGLAWLDDDGAAALTQDTEQEPA